MELPVLDLFILSLLDRDLKTPYDLQAQASMSLGASIPALKRLKEKGLVEQNKERRSSRKLRHCYTLTQIGRQQAKTGWKRYLDLATEGMPTDIDSVLRLADMAMHYRARQADVTRFLKQASIVRIGLAAEASAKSQRTTSANLRFRTAKLVCEAARLEAEARALTKLTESLKAGADKDRRTAHRRPMASPGDMLFGPDGELNTKPVQKARERFSSE